jgi:rhomboid protease GluP
MIGNKSPITTTLVGMNVAVFAVMVLTGVSPLAPTIPQLLKWGANYGPLSLGAEPWRILASNYVHGGIIHIALNMWCLWNLGFLAERISLAV